MKIHQFGAVLFDMDGVILDSMSYHADTWLTLLAAQGFEVTREFVLNKEGALGPETLMDLMRAQGLQGEIQAARVMMRDLLDQQVKLYLSQYAPLVQPFPFADRLLQDLNQAGVPAALVTSSRTSVVQNSLGDLFNRFQAVITADDVQRHKPHPDPYLAGAQALQIEPSACLVVENAPAGIQAALAAGATCYAVCSTLGPDNLSQAHHTFPDLEELALHLGLQSAG